MEKKPRTTEPSKQSQRRISRQINKHWILLSIGFINSELREPQMTHLNTHTSPKVLFRMQHLCSILSLLVHIQLQSTELSCWSFFHSLSRYLNLTEIFFFFFSLLKSAVYILQLQNVCMVTWKSLVCDSPGSK